MRADAFHYSGRSRSELIEASLLIDGVHVEGAGVREIRSPADRVTLIGRCAFASRDHVDQAVTAAHRASAAWRKTDCRIRAGMLLETARSLTDDIEDLATLLADEHGKTLHEAREEMRGAATILAWHAEQAAALDTQYIDDPRGLHVRRRVPFGVVAVIVPWNYPVLLAQLMVAPALLAGNSVVVKLPDYSPLSLWVALSRLAATLPPGVLNVLAGPGDVVGESLTSHRLVRKIAFTGSTTTGRRIMQSASATLKSLSLELGGNDPALILPDKRIDARLIEELIDGTLTNGGQVCYAPKRIYVPAEKVEEFCKRFVHQAASVRVGLPLNERVTMGPLNNAEQLQVAMRLLEDARERGAAISTLGTIEDNLPPDGFWMQPHLVSGIANDAPLVQEEQFGPVVPVIAYEDVDEAIAMANDTEYGLAASIWSDDREAALEVASGIDAGTVFLNVHRVGASAVDMPFGGFKQSGLGRGHGLEGIYEYTELQVIAERADMVTERG